MDKKLPSTSEIPKQIPSAEKTSDKIIFVKTKETESSSSLITQLQGSTSLSRNGGKNGDSDITDSKVKEDQPKLSNKIVTETEIRSKDSPKEKTVPILKSSNDFSEDLTKQKSHTTTIQFAEIPMDAAASAQRIARETNEIKTDLQRSSTVPEISLRKEPVEETETVSTTYVDLTQLPLDETSQPSSLLDWNSDKHSLYRNKTEVRSVGNLSFHTEEKTNSEKEQSSSKTSLIRESDQDKVNVLRTEDTLISKNLQSLLDNETTEFQTDKLVSEQVPSKTVISDSSPSHVCISLKKDSDLGKSKNIIGETICTFDKSKPLPSKDIEKLLTHKESDKLSDAKKSISDSNQINSFISQQKHDLIKDQKQYELGVSHMQAKEDTFDKTVPKADSVITKTVKTVSKTISSTPIPGKDITEKKTNALEESISDSFAVKDFKIESKSSINLPETIPQPKESEVKSEDKPKKSIETDKKEVVSIEKECFASLETQKEIQSSSLPCKEEVIEGSPSIRKDKQPSDKEVAAFQLQKDKDKVSDVIKKNELLVTNVEGKKEKSAAVKEDKENFIQKQMPSKKEIGIAQAESSISKENETFSTEVSISKTKEILQNMKDIGKDRINEEKSVYDKENIYPSTVSEKEKEDKSKQGYKEHTNILQDKVDAAATSFEKRIECPSSEKTEKHDKKLEIKSEICSQNQEQQQSEKSKVPQFEYQEMSTDKYSKSVTEETKAQSFLKDDAKAIIETDIKTKQNLDTCMVSDSTSLPKEEFLIGQTAILGTEEHLSELSKENQKVLSKPSTYQTTAEKITSQKESKQPFEIVKDEKDLTLSKIDQFLKDEKTEKEKVISEKQIETKKILPESETIIQEQLDYIKDFFVSEEQHVIPSTGVKLDNEKETKVADKNNKNLLQEIYSAEMETKVTDIPFSISQEKKQYTKDESPKEMSKKLETFPAVSDHKEIESLKPTVDKDDQTENKIVPNKLAETKTFVMNEMKENKYEFPEEKGKLVLLSSDSKERELPTSDDKHSKSEFTKEVPLIASAMKTDVNLTKETVIVKENQMPESKEKQVSKEIESQSLPSKSIPEKEIVLPCFRESSLLKHDDGTEEKQVPPTKEYSEISKEPPTDTKRNDLETSLQKDSSKAIPVIDSNKQKEIKDLSKQKDTLISTSNENEKISPKLIDEKEVSKKPEKELPQKTESKEERESPSNISKEVPLEIIEKSKEVKPLKDMLSEISEPTKHSTISLDVLQTKPAESKQEIVDTSKKLETSSESEKIAETLIEDSAESLISSQKLETVDKSGSIKDTKETVEKLNEKDTSSFKKETISDELRTLKPLADSMKDKLDNEIESKDKETLQTQPHILNEINLKQTSLKTEKETLDSQISLPKDKPASPILSPKEMTVTDKQSLPFTTEEPHIHTIDKTKAESTTQMKSQSSKQKQRPLPTVGVSPSHTISNIKSEKIKETNKSVTNEDAPAEISPTQSIVNKQSISESIIIGPKDVKSVPDSKTDAALDKMPSEKQKDKEVFVKSAAYLEQSEEKTDSSKMSSINGFVSSLVPDDKELQKAVLTKTGDALNQAAQHDVKPDIADVKPELESDVKTEVKSRVEIDTKVDVKSKKDDVKLDLKPEIKTDLKSEVKIVVKPDVKPDAKAEVKEEKPVVKAEAKPDEKTDLKVMKPDAKAEVKPDGKPDVKEVKPDLKLDAKEVKPDVKPDAKEEVKPDVKPDAKEEVQPDVKSDAKPDVKEVKPDLKLDAKEVKPDVKPDAKEEVKPDVKPDAKEEVQPDVKSDAKPDVKEMKPDMKPDVKAEMKHDTKPDVKEEKPDVKAEVKPDVKSDVKKEVKPDAELDVKTEVKPDVKEMKPDIKAEVKPDVKPETKQEPLDVKPEMKYDISKPVAKADVKPDIDDVESDLKEEKSEALVIVQPDVKSDTKLDETDTISDMKSDLERKVLDEEVLLDREEEQVQENEVHLKVEVETKEMDEIVSEKEEIIVTNISIESEREDKDTSQDESAPSSRTDEKFETTEKDKVHPSKKSKKSEISINKDEKRRRRRLRKKEEKVFSPERTEISKEIEKPAEEQETVDKTPKSPVKKQVGRSQKSLTRKETDSTPDTSKSPPSPSKQPLGGSQKITSSPKKTPYSRNGLLSPSKSLKGDQRKIPPIKAPVGFAPNPNLKNVKSKIGSFDNIHYKPKGGDKKVITVKKLEWHATSKIGSLENANYKPGGGDKKIISQKLEFKDKAQPKQGDSESDTDTIETLKGDKKSFLKSLQYDDETSEDQQPIESGSTETPAAQEDTTTTTQETTQSQDVTA
ncbi:microtubule-associated protein futsch-like isoform X4 [Centruroides vittatus]|uniref:microtubule-associated protein futsch-like isoform X4 n=1 Tax=Centruroides vittatus TaxID=120091 RepID=UPI00350E8E3A